MQVKSGIKMIVGQDWPFKAKMINWNFPLLEIVSRCRDPQIQVSENYSDLTKCRLTILKSCWSVSHFIFSVFKRWYALLYANLFEFSTSEVVSRYRDPQPQVAENYSYLFNLSQNIRKCWLTKQGKNNNSRDQQAKGYVLKLGRGGGILSRKV